jgi:hypothetical protein
MALRALFTEAERQQHCRQPSQIDRKLSLAIEHAESAERHTSSPSTEQHSQPQTSCPQEAPPPSLVKGTAAASSGGAAPRAVPTCKSKSNGMDEELNRLHVESKPDIISSSCAFGSSSETLNGVRHARVVESESKRVGDVSETRWSYKDSEGYERSGVKRGLKGQTKENLEEHTAKGQYATTENLTGISPHLAPDFDGKWEKERARVDPQGLMLTHAEQVKQLAAGAPAKQLAAEEPIQQIQR